MHSSTINERLEQKREAVRAECARRRIKIEQRGVIFHIQAPGVNMKTVDLSWIRMEDLAPVPEVV